MDVLELLLQWIMIIFLQVVPVNTMSDGQTLVYSSVDNRKQLVTMMEFTLYKKENTDMRIEGEMLLVFFGGLKQPQPLKEKIIHRRKVIVEFSVLNRSRVITQFKTLNGTDFLHREDGTTLDLVVKGPLRSTEALFLDRAITPGRMIDESRTELGIQRQYTVDGEMVETGVEVVTDSETGMPLRFYIPLTGLNKLFHDWTLMEY